MNVFVALAGGIIGLFALVFLVRPDFAKKMGETVLARRMLVIATALRIGFGILFILAAPDTKEPTIVYGLGILFVTAGVAIPVVGFERIAGWFKYWAAKPDHLFRLFAIIMGLFGWYLFFISGYHG